MFRRMPINLPGEVVNYLRAEQRKKLTQIATVPLSIVLRKPIQPISN